MAQSNLNLTPRLPLLFITMVNFLLVEELENSQTVFNQPAGHLEANENLISAVKT